MAANATQVATGGSYIAVSASNATLTTALKDAIDELEAQKASWSQTQITVTHDGTNYSVVAIVKRH